MSTETNQGTTDENTGSTEEVNTEETTDKEDERDTKIKDLESQLGSTKRDLKDSQKKVETLEKPKEEPSTSQESESNEPDYAKIGFLNGEDVRHPDDQKIVFDEAERLKLPLTDVLQMEHIKSKLTSQKDERSAQEGMPKGSGRKGGPNKGEVEYYIAHPDETPDDLELHNKVIDAKIKKVENENMFSDVPFTG